MSGPITSLFLTERTALSEWRSQWNATLARSGIRLVQLSFEWLDTWWKYFGSGRDIRIWIAHEAGHLRGIAPFCLEQRRIGLLRIPALNLLSNPYSTRSAIALADSDPGTLTSQLQADLKQLPWTMLATARLSDDGAGTKLFQPDPHGLCARRVIRQRYRVPIVAVEQEWDRFIASKSANFRRSLRRNSGIHHFQARHFPGDFSDISATFALIDHVSRATWKHGAGTSLAANPTAQAFFQELLATCAASKQAQVTLLLDGNTPVAFMFGIHFHGRLFALKTGFDERYREHGPGFSTMHAFLRETFQRAQVDSVDLDCLSEHGDYKARWATSMEFATDAWCFPRTIKGRVLGWAYQKARLLKTRHSKDKAETE